VLVTKSLLGILAMAILTGICALRKPAALIGFIGSLCCFVSLSLLIVVLIVGVFGASQNLWWRLLLNGEFERRYYVACSQREESRV
jgi:hypothetical protein